MEYVSKFNPGSVYNTVVKLQSLKTEHQRKVYGFLGFIGDIGGVTEIVMKLFGFFVLPFSEFSFNLKAMKKLFLVRTTD